jgi:large subunit ribosomal protein L21
MYAIVEIAEFKVNKDLKVYVNRLTNEEGSKFLLTKFFIRWQRNYHFR